MAAERRLKMLEAHLSTGEAEAPSTMYAAPVSGKGPMFEGQVVIVTGSGQGIGARAAQMFAEQGASVVVTDLDAGKSDAVAAEIKQKGGKAISVPGDVTSAEFPDKLMKATIDAFGKLHILVNNAGYTWDGMLHRMTDKQWEAMIAVHNTAPFRLIRAATPYMREAAKKEQESFGEAAPRCVINVSSTVGLHGNVGQLNYSTAKAGVIGMTKSLAKEWGPFNIRCNAVAFGMIRTRLTDSKEKGVTMQVDGEKVKLGVPAGLLDSPMALAMIPLKRAGTVDDAAGGIVLLASPLASYVSGHTLEVTGGAGI